MAVIKFIILLFFSLMLACGPGNLESEELDTTCQPSDIGYLHTASHCGEFLPENVRSIFILCNPLKADDAEGCCQEDTMQELEDNCFLTNVCMEPWEYE